MKSLGISYISSLALVLLASSALGDECIANSPSELQLKFEQAFNSKNNDEILSLFSWEGIDQDMEKILKNEFSNLTLNKNSIRSELRTPDIAIKDAKSMGLYLNVIPIKTFYFERSFGPEIDLNNKTDGNLAVGKVGNCFLFGTYSKTKIVN